MKTILQTSEQDYLTCIKTVEGLNSLPFTSLPEGGLRLTFDAMKGLYQFSVLADATEFNWEDLYVDLHLFSNHGERTGPWDFSLLNNNAPLVPSYWVTVDGRKIGLWFFQRVSIEDMTHRRFRGRAAFLLEADGEHTLDLVPYRSMTLRWTSATLELDPEDRLQTLRFEPIKTKCSTLTGYGKTIDLTDWHNRCPASRFAKPSFWENLREGLNSSHKIYQEPLEHAFAWLSRQTKYQADQLPLLWAACHLKGSEEARQSSLRTIDEILEQPHWNNPHEDAYGHDGDMGAMSSFRALAWACHACRPDLGEERFQRLLAKLQLQGNRFVALALLNRDYWGGSVQQDHGWKSLFGFGDGALHLLDLIPDAERWVSFVIPRLQRSLESIPRDGVIPWSSYCTLYLYLDELTLYRETYLALTGEDVFDEAPFHLIVDYLTAIVREEDHLMLLEYPFPLMGGNAFLNLIANKYRDSRAATLQSLILKTPEMKFYHGTQEYAYYLGAFWGFLTYDPTVKPVDQRPQRKALSFFEDAGLVSYRDPLDDITLTLRCGPFTGYHGYRHAQGPCDRLGFPPGTGHFTLYLGAEQHLHTPDSGYKMTSALRSCLLIDGKGQRDDVGYPMSIPSKLDYGEEIQFARWDEEQQRGWVRMNLAPAYPEAMGLALYYRDLLFYPGQKIICRDQVVLDKPHQLSWLFQGKREQGVVLVDDLTGHFGSTPRLQIVPQLVGAGLKASLCETPVVWSYSSMTGFRPFDHLRYDTLEPTASVTVDFVMTWCKG